MSSKAHHKAVSSYVKEINAGGKHGYEIKPKGLNIVWGNDSRYWKIHDPGTAELIQVSWLEVSGMVEVKRGKKYEVKFNVSVKENGFGWSGTKVLVMAKLGKKGKYKEPKQVFLNPGDDLTIPSYGSGSLIVEVPNVGPDRQELYFGLYEVWSGKWKGGLEIKGANVIEI